MQPTFFQSLKQKLVDFWNTNKRRKRFWIIAAIIVVIILVIAINKPKADDRSVAVVARRDIAETIVLSGRTQSGSEVKLNFADSGRVASVPVKEGQKVSAGQVLASLESGELNAQLTIARAGLANTNVNLENVTREQNALVENAHRALLSEGLEAVPEDVDSDARPPVITGTYRGGEGKYVLTIYPSNSGTGYSFRTSGLETGSSGPVSATSVPLGTQGLYISFDTASNYAGTHWIVEIPNKRSAYYVTNYNAYQSALATRDRVIADAQADVSSSSTEASIAQARVDSILAQIAKRRIVAPFSGTVANVTIKVGENASSGVGASEATTSAITLISESDYEVLLKAPEVDIAKLSVGQKADVVLDAYGDQVFSGTIVSINPAETIIDGVPVYETKVVFDAPDARVRSGMTATATIVPARKDGVLAIPANFIHTDPANKNTAYVFVLIDDDKTEKRVIQTGLRGSDSYVEVVSGLSEGEKVRVDELK